MEAVDQPPQQVGPLGRVGDRLQAEAEDRGVVGDDAGVQVELGATDPEVGLVGGRPTRRMIRPSPLLSRRFLRQKRLPGVNEKS